MPDQILELLHNTPKIDIHEHLRTIATVRKEGGNLTGILPKCYFSFYDFYPGLREVRFPLNPSPIPKEIFEQATFVHNFQGKDVRDCYYEGIRRIHRLEPDPPNISIWNKIDASIQNAYHNLNFYNEVFSQHKIQTIITDIPYDPLGTELSETLGRDFAKKSGILKPIQLKSLMRLNSLFFGFDPECWQPATNLIKIFSTQVLKQDYPSNFDEYLSIIRKLVNWAPKHIIGFKCASAYERTLDFGNPKTILQEDYSKARAIFNQKIRNVTESDIIRFGNYVFHYTLNEIRNHPLPIQIHTGTAIMPGSHPNNLRPTLEHYSDLQFELLHYGYPSVDAVTQLLQDFPNVYSDFVWLPQLNGAIIEKLVQDLTRLRLWERIMAFGGDTACAEGSIGALMVLIKRMTNGFQKELESNALSMAEIEQISEKIFLKTPKKFFHLA